MQSLSSFPLFFVLLLTLNLHFRQPVLPKCRKGCDAILAEIYQDVHAFVTHRFAHVDVVLFDICCESLQSIGRSGLELFGLLFAVWFGLERVIEAFNVCWL